jgi:DNA-binding NarL/FixJ family response regulator
MVSRLPVVYGARRPDRMGAVSRPAGKLRNDPAAARPCAYDRRRFGSLDHRRAEMDPMSQTSSGEPARRLRILVVDDHPMYREGLVMTLAAAADFDPVGQAGDGEAALELAATTRPDIVLMDLRLPGISGIEATRRLVAAMPGIRVVVVSMLEDDDSIFAAMRAGASGYLLKGSDRDELLSALRAVSLGEVIFGAAIARRVMAFFTGRPSAAAAIAFPELTDREREILERIAHGDPNPVIARTFGLTDKTIRNHVSNILNKLQVADRAQAVARARDAGLGTG